FVGGLVEAAGGGESRTPRAQDKAFECGARDAPLLAAAGSIGVFWRWDLFGQLAQLAADRVRHENNNRRVTGRYRGGEDAGKIHNLREPEDGIVAISAAQLVYMLDGIDWPNPVRTWRPPAAG